MKPLRKNVRWSHNLAYAIGLLTTDGCLSKDGRHIDFTSKDIELIKTFKCCLKLNNKIAEKISGLGNKCLHIQFGDVRLYEFLLNIGLMPHKSKIIGQMNIPDKYFFDFLRGHLDGDGHISVYKDPIYPNSQRLYVRFACASLKHLQWIQEQIQLFIKIKGNIQQGTKGYFELRYPKAKSKILLNAIYYKKYLPSLERKRKIAEAVLYN